MTSSGSSSAYACWNQVNDLQCKVYETVGAEETITQSIVALTKQRVGPYHPNCAGFNDSTVIPYLNRNDNELAVTIALLNASSQATRPDATHIALPNPVPSATVATNFAQNESHPFNGSAITQDPKHNVVMDRPGKVLHTTMKVEADDISSKDVLFGRGKHHRDHPGNAQMRNLTRAFYPAYIACQDRDEKTHITKCIVDSIRLHGGRFLKYDKEGQCWVVVSEEEARQKVSHAIRDDPGVRSLRSSKVVRRLCALAPSSLRLTSEEANMLIEMFVKARGMRQPRGTRTEA